MENFGNTGPVGQPPVNTMPGNRVPEEFLPPILPGEFFINEHYEAKSKRKVGKKIFGVLVILAIFTLVGLGAWYWLKSDKTAEVANLGGNATGGNQPISGILEGDSEKTDTPNESSNEEKTEDEEKSEQDTESDQPTQSTETEQPAAPETPAQPSQPTEQPKPGVKKEVVTMSFDANGANIGATKLTREKNGTDCKIKLPVIARDGWEIVGWSSTKSAKKAEYVAGEEISVSRDQTLYAITRREIVVSFEKNGATAISATERSCTMYNTASSCRIETPSIVKAGWNILGWSEDANAKIEQYRVSTNISFSENKVLYAITSK